jgi:thioredoxin reductase (NADPH)
MVKPILLTVDDDPEVLRAVERDLRRQYGSTYRVIRAESGRAALEALERLRARGDPVAMLIADQRMPEMTGVEFLEQARQLFPDAKRVLLTAYADTDAAIRAINNVRIHYYLMKPWDPPQENLYPYLTDLLDDWAGFYRPAFDGIRVIGMRWERQSHVIRDFLGRNLVPFKWMDLDGNDEARALLAATTNGTESPKLPVVVYPDGSHDADPTPRQIAERIGLRSQAEKPFYDLIVIGAGPAGLAAAVYGASEGLRTVMIEREAPGGQAGTSSNIENYLGFPAGLTGADLTRRGVTQAKKFGAEILNPREVTSLRAEGDYRIVRLDDEYEISARAVLIATGVSYHLLDVPGADLLTGAGIYYGATSTDAKSCVNEEVFLIGAGNSAGQAAIAFAEHARAVTMLVRGPSLEASMSQYLIDQIAKNERITVRTRARVVAVSGSERLSSITVMDAQGRCTIESASSLYVFIGAAPRTDWLAGAVARDARGFILTGGDLMSDGKRPKGWPLDRDPYLLEASIPGVFVAGDVRHQSVKRVASAVGEGSIAVQFTHQYLAER